MYMVRRSVPGDARRVWEIRYHPLVNQVAIVQTPVPYEQHEPWFWRRYCSPDNTDVCFVLCADDMVIGYCRFDRQAEEFIVSIALDPDHHGRGLGTLFLRQALDQLNSDLPVKAIIKKDNARSHRLFIGRGFDEAGDEGDCIILRLASSR
jgi:RimJ/RimL family protein N-acetyltransferase